jgi:hypothetical protein
MSVWSTIRARRRIEAIASEVKRVQTSLTPNTKVRVVTAVKRSFLLNTNDELCFYGGLPYKIVWKSLGAGVHEARLELWKEKT